MTNRLSCLALLLFSFGAENSLAQSAEEDVYVKIYKVRRDLAAVSAQIETANIEFTEKTLERTRRLVELNSASAEEYEVKFREDNVARASKASFEAETAQREALLQIVTDQVTIGIEPPICLQLR